jgi:hypothetical protein
MPGHTEETILRMKRFALLPVLFGAPLFASINYVTNGGFENGATSGAFSPSVPGDLIYAFGVGGQTNIAGWTVSASSVNNGSANPLSLLVVGDPPQVPAGGSYAVDFDPFWNVKTGALLGPTVTGTLPQLSQNIFLPAGGYVLSFEGALEQSGVERAVRPLAVSLTGAATLRETAIVNTPDDIGYTKFSYAFTSTGGNVDLTFTPNDFSPEPNFMLDDVSITAATPEPYLGVPVALGLLALSGWKYSGRGSGARPV